MPGVGRASGRAVASPERRGRILRRKPGASGRRASRVERAATDAAGANRTATNRRRGSSRQTAAPLCSNRRVNTVEAPCQ